MRYQAPLAAFVLLAGLAAGAQAQTETTIHTFTGKADGTRSLGVAVSSGEVYVPTILPGTGRLFKFAPSGSGWTKTDIQHYSYTLGAYPGPMIADESGALYGVTTNGGPGLCNNGRPVPKVIGCGTVYKLTRPTVKNPAAKWVRTVLYNFTNTGDGFFPVGKLTRDASGALYGVTQSVPNAGPCTPTCGGIFKLTPPASPGGAWTEQLLYTFTSISEGSDLNDGLAVDGNGVVYGTTHFGTGNPTGSGDGTVYSLTPPTTPGGAWTKTTIQRFDFFDALAHPSTGLLVDANGALYGTAFANPNLNGTAHPGAVFKLTPPASPGGVWTRSTVFAFDPGCGSRGGLIADSAGQLFGTTLACGTNNSGTVFRLSPPAIPGDPWTQTVLYNFPGPETGLPDSQLAADGAGTLYGSSSGIYSYNGLQSGSVFAITNSGFVP